jgi:hypothetical protein
MSLYNGDLKVGDMFYAPTNEEDWGHTIRFEMKHLGEFYYQNNVHRRPLFVILPGPAWFSIDGQARNAGVFHDAWTVAGEAPNITVTPSINLNGTYHGFLQNGIISDDVEGRKYDEEGYEVRNENPGS